jgi:nucleoside-diphosphate-sugar epimerase
MTTYVVTGLSGQIGLYLQTFQKKNDHLTHLPFRDFNSKKTKIFLRNQDTDFELIHLGWPVSNSDYQNSDANTKASQNSIELFSIAIEAGVRHIHGIGTILENGIQKQIQDQSQEDPRTLYAEKKIEVKNWLKNHAKEISSWYRIAYLISENDPKHKLIPTLLGARGQSIELKNPDDRFDFIHGSDAAEALWSLIKRMDKDEFSDQLVGCGRTISPREIAVSLGVKVINPQNMESFSQETFTAALNETGWQPKFKTVELLAERIFSSSRY